MEEEEGDGGGRQGDGGGSGGGGGVEEASGGDGANTGDGGAWNFGEGVQRFGDAIWPFGMAGNGDGGFWMRGLGAGMAMSGRGPVAFPGGLLIITGGDGGSGLKLEADQTVDFCVAGRGAGGAEGG